MTKTTVINKIYPKYDKNEIQLGDYFKNKYGDVYIVMKISINHLSIDTFYFLANVVTGGYWAEPTENIENVFNGFEDKFTRIDNVLITIS